MNTIMESSLGIILLAIFAIAFIIYLVKGLKDKKAMEKFLEGLSCTITESILEIIESIDTKDYDNFEEFEQEILDDIYNDCFIFIKTQAEEAFDENPVMKSILNKLTKETVKKFIDKILERIDGIATIKYKFFSNSIEGMEEEDNKLAEEFSDQSIYVEESNNDELEPADEVAPSEEELAELNPQRDEEELYNENDSSMEIVEETSSIVTAQDKNGNTLYYEVTEDGKRKRVSKEYAITKMI